MARHKKKEAQFSLSPSFGITTHIERLINDQSFQIGLIIGIVSYPNKINPSGVVTYINCNRTGSTQSLGIKGSVK